MKTLMFILIVASLLVSGCAGPLNDTNANALETNNNATGVSDSNIHQYVTQLAKQLFLTSDMIRLNKRVAVGTFLPMMDINGKYMPASNALGQQIQESFVTLATQAGMSVIEFKATTAIKIQENQDIMLSRKVSEINSRIKADYYLTGTYSTLEQSITVNVRLIDVNTQKVIAAATDFIPTNVMWSQPKVSQPQVTMKDNRFYRGPF